MASQNDYDVFSIRIVSLDYYMSPPIPDLDICDGSFLGTKVEEVPVIRIYGATPAGQKTCLHVHRALPYFYVPFPEDLLQSPKEGQTFIHSLSGAIEKALRHKSISTSKRQHVHGCSLVRAKKLYGYYSSEELFVKIFLYYPHEISRAASLLLDGSILGNSFQPYESHIPYLLQFLVDYNLNGMSHLHTSKVRFRSPLTYCYNAASIRHKDYDMQATLGSREKPKIWLSSTVPSSAVWPDSTGLDDSTGSKFIHLVRRQSICQLEADANVEDIINEKFKIYTSLSQTKVDVRMVQSLAPIWEEECELSGIQEATKQHNPCKPQAERVLRSFMDGLNYDKTLYEMCIETCNSFPSKNHVDGNEKLVKYMKSLSDISMKIDDLGSQQHIKSCDTCLVSGEEEIRNKATSSSQSLMKGNPKSLDNEALGLLSWLASSQAEEEMETGDELLHEAILSPLLTGKSYSMALEIAHRDYEHASQLECQAILDSVEDILKSERLKEKASSSFQDLILDSVQGIPKSEGLKEQALSSSQGLLDVDSSDVAIPQVDGSFDDSWKTPQKKNTSEEKTSCGEENSAAQYGKMGLRAGHKNKEEMLWGNLLCSVSKSEREASDSFCVVSSPCGEMINDGSNPPFLNKDGDRYDDFKNEIGIENYSEKGRKTLGFCSVRDLMRKKRTLRVEQAETEIQKNVDIGHGQKEELTPTTFVRDFYKEEKNHEFIEMAFINKPPSINHIHGPEESLPAGQANGNIDERQRMENIMPFFPSISQDVNLHDKNVIFGLDSALGIPTHFQNDGSVLYLLTHAQSPPTLNTVNEWLSAEKQRCLLDTAGASNEGLNSYCDGVLNEGTFSCQTSTSPTAVGWSQYDPSQSNNEKCCPETENFHPHIGHISSEPKLDNIPPNVKVVNEDLSDLSQISGPEKYENSIPTPVSQIGFRDPSSVGGGQQLTLISMEIQAESRGDLRPDPKFDSINILSLVVQEDASNTRQTFVLLRVMDEKLGEKLYYGMGNSTWLSWLSC